VDARVNPNTTDSATVVLSLPDEWLNEIARRVVALMGQAPTDDADPWMTVTEAAKHIRCTTSRIYKLVEQGSLPHHREGRRLLFKRSELDSFIRSGGAFYEKYPGLHSRVVCMPQPDTKRGAAMPQTPRPVAEEVLAPHA
jgi:excisionase family DNA binding protein